MAATKKFRVRLQPLREGGFVATCESPVCMSRARTREEVLEKIKAEIRYRLEWCPCTGVDDDYVQLEIS
jgi:predicted RNase H-like HicB family nuclease